MALQRDISPNEVVKELSSHIKEEIKIHAEQQQEKQLKYLGSLKRHNGHDIWEIDLKTGKISKAEFSDEAVNFETGVAERKIITKENHWYCSALNNENAFKKFNAKAKTLIQYHHDRTTSNR